MTALIVEDEDLAAEALLKIIENQNILRFEKIAREDSVENAVNFLAAQTPDLIFLDIHLGDGSGFEILDAMQPHSKIVFVTAYEEHALKAHEYNTAGYITKPFDRAQIYKLLSKLNIPEQKEREYQRRFLVSEAGKMLSLKDSEIAYFYAEGKNLFINTFGGASFLYESTLAKISEETDPKIFFKINRNVCLNIEAVLEVTRYSGQRLMVNTQPAMPESDLGIVAKTSMTDFKNWLDF